MDGTATIREPRRKGKRKGKRATSTTVTAAPSFKHTKLFHGSFWRYAAAADGLSLPAGGLPHPHPGYSQLALAKPLAAAATTTAAAAATTTATIFL